MRSLELPPYVRELAGPATNAMAVVAIAGATASLHFSGRLRGGKALIVAEVGAVLATAAFCAWRFWRKRPPEAADLQLPGKVAKEAAVHESPKATEGCCGGVCGASCDGENLSEDELQGEEGGDLEDLQSSGDEIKSATRAAARATYVQPKAARRRAAKRTQKDSPRGESGSEEVDLPKSAVTPGCAEETSDEAVFLPGRAKVYFKTFGCSHNVSDSEYMRKRLRASHKRSDACPSRLSASARAVEAELMLLRTAVVSRLPDGRIFHALFSLPM